MPQAPLSDNHASRVKAARRLAKRSARTQERLFLAEGPQAVREALGRPHAVTEVFATGEATRRHPELEQAARETHVPWQSVPAEVLASLAETVTPQGVVAVCHHLDVSLAALAATAPRLVAVCVSVRDPGNVGTLVRCADAAGADGIVLTGTSVDVYNGKAVRASAGSLFHLPICIGATLTETVDVLHSCGLVLLAADAKGETDLDAALDAGDLAQPTGWLFGNEAWGLPPDAVALADEVVRVPIHGRAESLNLAAAAAVCLYASARAQRRSQR